MVQRIWERHNASAWDRGKTILELGGRRENSLWKGHLNTKLNKARSLALLLSYQQTPSQLPGDRQFTSHHFSAPCPLHSSLTYRMFSSVLFKIGWLVGVHTSRHITLKTINQTIIKPWILALHASRASIHRITSCFKGVHPQVNI